ncbi:MAG: SNF2-related protein, partial [Blastocatellia bacterium]
MAKKISYALRRRLREAARARWARYRKEEDQKEDQLNAARRRWARSEPKLSRKPGATIKPPVAAAEPAAAESLPAVVAAIDLPAMRRIAGAGIVKRGAAVLSNKKALKIEHLSENRSQVLVDDDGSYQVVFELEDGEIVSTCNCPFGRITAAVVCKHKIAAALLLREKYVPEKRAEKKVESKWREELAMMLRPDLLPAKAPSNEGLLFFSFVKRNGMYVAQPGVIAAAAVPKERWHDRAALSEYLVENRNVPEIRYAVDSLSTDEFAAYLWVNSTPGDRLMVRHAFDQMPSMYASYYTQMARPPLWEGLADKLVFFGDDDQLIKAPAEVVPGIGTLEMEMNRTEQGLRLSPVIALSGDTIPLNTRDLSVLHSKPLWLCQGPRVFQAAMTLDQVNGLLRQAEVIVPTEALDEFYNRRFADVIDSFPLRGEAARTETLTGAAPQPRAYLLEAGSELQVSLRFGYNGLECLSSNKPPAFSYARDAERDVAVKVERQADPERTWRERLGGEEFGLKVGRHRDRTTPDILLLRKGIHPYDFLKNRVPKLTEAGVEIYGEADLSARINRAHPYISFEITSEIDWFDLKAIVHWGDLEVPLAEIRKSLRKQEQFIKLADGTIGEIPADWLEKYKHLFGLSETREEGMRVARHHVALLDQLLGESDRVKTDKQFEGARAWLKNFEGIEAKPLPEGFQGELRPYQKAGFDWLHFLREARFGGCLADDMGTGKTIQTLCFLQSIKESYEARNRRKRRKESRGAHLLVVPRSLVTNWEREAAKFAPGLRILDFAHLDRPADVTEFDQHDIVLTTYGIMLREIDRLREYEFDTVILDEAQAIKNPVSESAKAARLLACRHRLTLTGTPVENNTLELWSQFAFLNPGMLGSADYFREEFMGPIERQNDEPTTRTLKRLVYPFILRRTKDQVALDLPPRTEKILWGEMEPAQRTFYNETRDEYRARILKLIEDKGVKNARFRILEGLLRLRQICNHPRLVRPSYKGGSAKM